MGDTLDEAKAALVKSKGDMAKYYDWTRTPALDYQPGDKVLIVRKVGNGAYRLKLPLSMSRLLSGQPAN